jgi:2-polyprenyl-3-methyl-5-hydroxy-6-metoxy-1,4-benzoquinol methylase
MIRALARARAHAHGAAVRAGVRSYRPLIDANAERWSQEYIGDVGQLAYAPLVELSRYSLLAGYLRHLGQGLSVLDLGCGHGLFRERIEELPFARYLGIDFAAEAIHQAGRLEDERTFFRVGELPEPDEVFDVVVCNENLECVPDPARYVDGVHGHLVPGGHLLVSILRHPSDFALHRLLDERFELLDAVEARNLTSWRSRRWRVSCHRRTA